MNDRDRLQVSILGETGEAIVQVFGGYGILTIRQPDKERLAEVQLTPDQAGALSDVLQRIVEPD